MIWVVLLLLALIGILFQDNHKLNRNMKILQSNYKELKKGYDDLDVQFALHRRVAHGEDPYEPTEKSVASTPHLGYNDHSMN